MVPAHEEADPVAGATTTAGDRSRACSAWRDWTPMSPRIAASMPCTAAVLRRNGITCQEVHKHSGEKLEAGERTIVEMIRDGEVDMVINTPYGNSGPRVDGYEIRSAAVAMNIPCVTTVQGASAAVQGIEAAIRGDIGVQSLQALHERLRSPAVVVAPASGSASS